MSKKIQVQIYADSTIPTAEAMVDQIIFFREDSILTDLTAEKKPSFFHLQKDTFYINQKLVTAVRATPYFQAAPIERCGEGAG